jgi:hypothetical protein
MGGTIVTTTLDQFTEAYLICALWSSTQDDGRPMDDDYGIEDIAPESIASAVEECRCFQADNASDLEGMTAEQAGHDFWLTRNGHGAGFWDRGLGKVGARLTAACKPWGSSDVYVGDDGQVYLT